MAKRPHLRITTWPGSPVGVPDVRVNADVRVDGEYLYFGGSIHLPRPTYQRPSDQLYLFELADVDLHSVEAVADLCRRHGQIASEFHRGDLPIRAPHEWHRTLIQQAQTYGRSFRDFQDVDKPANATSVHVDEFTLRVRIVRQLTRHLLAHANGSAVAAAWPNCPDDVEAWSRFEEYTNAALTPFQVRVEVDLGHPDFDMGVPRPYLYSAAVLQMVNDLSEHVDFMTCAAEKCGRSFVRQRGRSQHYSRSSGVVYCSASCANAQAQREWRRRQKANAPKPRRKP